MKRVEWSDLGTVYSNTAISKIIEQTEREINVVDETSFFATLVNTSLSKKQPFHRWVRYREGYAGELVKEILRRYPIVKNKDFVLDPMCGSGSTNVACRELGINSLGLDVNPFAVLATNVKNYIFDPSFINSISIHLEKIIFEFERANSVTLNEFELGIEKYFNSENLIEIVKIKRLLEKIKHQQTSNFFKLALLAILEDCSNRKKDGNGLATRPSKIQFVLERFTQQCEIMLEDCNSSTNIEYSTTTSCIISALEMSSAIFDFKKKHNKTLGSIIFSPPYANSFDYFESYKLELIFGEYCKLEELNTFRKNLIRNYRLSNNKKKLTSSFEIVNMLADEIEMKIPLKEKITGKRDGRTRLVPNMLCAYFEDMGRVLQNCYSALKQNGMVHIVIDQSSYVGVPIPTDSILAIIGKNIGFEIVSTIKCRKAATSGQQLKQFPYLNHLLRETIVTLRKV